MNVLKGLLESALIIAFLAFLALLVRSLLQAAGRVARGGAWSGDEIEPERFVGHRSD